MSLAASSTRRRSSHLMTGPTSISRLIDKIESGLCVSMSVHSVRSGSQARQGQDSVEFCPCSLFFDCIVSLIRFIRLMASLTHKETKEALNRKPDHRD